MLCAAHVLVPSPRRAVHVLPDPRARAQLPSEGRGPGSRARRRRGAGPTDVTPADGGDPARADGELASLLDDVRRRLRVACRGWGDSEFEALVDRIARMKWRWRAEGRDAR
jgi:hypothetical protein